MNITHLRSHQPSAPASTVDFFATWDSTEIPHLAVVGHIGDGRAAVVDQVIAYFTRRPASVVMLYPALNPYLAAAGTLGKGAEEAEEILKVELAELHRRYTALEKRQTVELSPILIVVDALEELLATTTDPHLMHRLQLDIEAIAILGKNVGLHLVFSGDEMPYLAEQARRDVGTIAIASERDALAALPIGSGWFFAPRSTDPRAVRLAADANSQGRRPEDPSATFPAPNQHL